MSENTEMTATETQDPNVLGQAKPEEVERIALLKSQVGQLLAECGRRDIDLSRLATQVKEIEESRAQMIQHIETIEAEGKRVLDEIAKRFDIPEGQPWQYLPDGTVKRVDPEMLRAAEAAQAAARAPSEEAPQE
jgi:chromosome segregation ATPase